MQKQVIWKKNLLIFKWVFETWPQGKFKSQVEVQFRACLAETGFGDLAVEVTSIKEVNTLERVGLTWNSVTPGQLSVAEQWYSMLGTIEEGINKAWTPSQAIRAGRARPPLQWTLNSVLSTYGNDNGRVRPPLGRGILKTTSRSLIA